MCGIVGYIGDKNAKDVIIDGLKRLEYRGYDSAGIAVIRNGKLEVRKHVGEIANLEATPWKAMSVSVIQGGQPTAPLQILTLIHM